MTIEHIEAAAWEVGVEVVVTNSEERIESQLNSLTRDGDMPILLINWDIETKLQFDENGFLKNPNSNIVSLLMKKAEDNSVAEKKRTTKEMGTLFRSLMVALYKILVPFQRDLEKKPLEDISYKDLPSYGHGKHSGVIGKFTVSDSVDIECT